MNLEDLPLLSACSKLCATTLFSRKTPLLAKASSHWEAGEVLYASNRFEFGVNTICTHLPSRFYRTIWVSSVTYT